MFRRGDEVVGYFPFQKRGGAVLPIAAPMNDYHGVIGPKAVSAPALAGSRLANTRETITIKIGGITI